MANMAKVAKVANMAKHWVYLFSELGKREKKPGFCATKRCLKNLYGDTCHPK
jgi:hypothetical protein